MSDNVSHEFSASGNDRLAAKMLSAHPGIAPVFKIAFEEHGKKVSDLVSMMKSPKIGVILPADNGGRTLKTKPSDET